MNLQLAFQNVENQYITQTDRINNNDGNANSNDHSTTTTNLATMAGYFDKNRGDYSSKDINLEGIQIYYDPLPTSESYKLNHNRTWYALGKLVGEVVQSPQPGGYYKPPKNYTLIEAN